MKIVNELSANKKIVAMHAAKARDFLCAKNSGIDGLLVTVGLCIIALVLCVVMKQSLSDFITTIVTSMQQKAIGILDVTTVS